MMSLLYLIIILLLFFFVIPIVFNWYITFPRLIKAGFPFDKDDKEYYSYLFIINILWLVVGLIHLFFSSTMFILKTCHIYNPEISEKTLKKLYQKK